MKVKIIANMSGDKEVPLVMNVAELDDACAFVNYFAMCHDGFDVQIIVSF